MWSLTLAFAGSASADTTIGFDDLPPGTVLTNQFANVGGSGQGVVFGPLPGEAGDSVARPFIASAPQQAHSGTQVARIDCPDCNEGLGFVPDTTGTFPSAHSQVSVYVGYLGSPGPVCIAGGSAVTRCADVTLTAYDASGNRVGTQATARVGQGQAFTQLAVSTPSPQIVGFEIKGSADDSNKQIAIDDLGFDTPSAPLPPDFTLTAASTAVAVTDGQSVSDQISIGRIAGSVGQIQLDVGGLPAGVHAQVAPDPADSAATLTLSADRTVTPSQGTITVTGTPLSSSAGSSPRTLTLSLRVESACEDVLTAQELINALGSGCQRIYVDDSANIDLAYVALHHDQFPGYDALNTYGDPQGAVIHIPDGVTLASDRSPTHLGGRLYMSQNLTDPGAMLELRSGDRVAGLRLDGYSQGRGGDETWTIEPGNNIGTTDGLNISTPDVFIDNNEISGWPGSGINVQNGSYEDWPPGPIVNEPRPPRNSQEDRTIAALAHRIHITNNFIHDNVGCIDGYGIVVGRFALIDHNVFDYNKHDVSGDGTPGTGYIAESNLTLTDGVQCRSDHGTGDLGYGGHFDMHGTAGGSGSNHVGGTAGTYIEVRDNAIRGDQRYQTTLGLRGKRRPAFDIRGTPTDKAIFAGNVTEAPSDKAVAVSGLSLGQLLTFRRYKLLVSDNSYSVNTSQELAVGDFDGDGCSDVFLATGAVWVYSPCGRGAWRYLNTSRYRLGQLAFGDFNGDGKTDVFLQNGDRWYVSYGATTAFEPLPAGSSIPTRYYRFGDLNGDGKTDIFRANGSHFYYSSAGATTWIPLAASHLKIGDVRLCDFNGDGKTDVFSLANHQWSVSYGGTTQWQHLNNRLSSNLGELVFADFNGDGRCDIARAHGHGFQISWGGTTPWDTQPTRYQADATFTGKLLGNFEGGKRQDILDFAVNGHALERFQLSSDFGPFNEFWSQQNML